METMQPWNQGIYPGMPFNQRPFRTQPPGANAAGENAAGAIAAGANAAGEGNPLAENSPLPPAGSGAAQTVAQNTAQMSGYIQSSPAAGSQAAARDYTQQVEWLKGAGREERLEAKRLHLQANFSFEGYQVVRREFLSHNFDPAMTIRGTSITFNNACISKLEEAMYIHFLINVNQKRLVIRAVHEGDKDAVRWCVVRGDRRKSRQITCRRFTEKLYDVLGWDTVYRYKMQGVKINYLGEEMFLFDLTEVERFLPQTRDPDTGKVTRPAGELPEAWEGSLGMGVEEHEKATEVDLNAGFISPEELEGTGDGYYAANEHGTAYENYAAHGAGKTEVDAV